MRIYWELRWNEYQQDPQGRWIPAERALGFPLESHELALRRKEELYFFGHPEKRLFLRADDGTEFSLEPKGEEEQQFLATYGGEAFSCLKGIQFSSFLRIPPLPQLLAVLSDYGLSCSFEQKEQVECIDRSYGVRWRFSCS